MFKHAVVEPGTVPSIPVPDVLLFGLPDTPVRGAAYGLLDGMLRDLDAGSVADLVKDDLGRPFSPRNLDLFVSLAHTDGAVAAAISTEGRIGIDVEATTHYDPDIGNLVLTSAQRALIEASANPDAHFLRLWTRKEAIGKALGVGIEDDVLRCPAENDRVLLRGHSLCIHDLSAPVGCYAAIAFERKTRDD